MRIIRSFILVYCCLWANWLWAQSMILSEGTDSLLFFNKSNKTMVLSPDTSLRIGGHKFESSSILELNTTNKGILIPRLTTVQRDAINTKAESMLIYNTDNSQFEVYVGASVWEPIYQLSNFPSIAELVDDDNDTKVQVEEMADEDIIRFDVGGIERWRMEGGRFTPPPGTHILIGGNTGASIVSANGIIAIGAGAYQNSTGGWSNIAIGANTMENVTNAQFNVAIGTTACQDCRAGGHNIVLGNRALEDNLDGEKNVAIGTLALWRASIDNGGVSFDMNNVAIGYESLRNTTGGVDNTAVGVTSGRSNSGGAQNTFIGANADCGIGTLTNATAIGANTIVMQSNTVILGNNADIGIGTSNPTTKLQVGENADGTFAIANAWNVFSDSTLKKGITPLKSTMQAVEQLGGYYYYWKEGMDTTRQLGVIAQEVENVLPEIVHTTPIGYKSVDYSKLTALLIEVNKEQNIKIQQQEKDIAELKKLVNQMQNNFMQKEVGSFISD